ncbi:ribosome recycling factor [Vibrio sp. ES.051]|uniref:ribosome recycling factor family protein n=1 Tax=Vibrio sp. ES.051 TaxID=1761909 RepID=UPI000BF5A984|nr:ribosome recycling factor family protein [Vibrio sp. ES.051]PFG57779.1 ribosome recycling factor [Vibrio sp. ES.051]
MNDHNITVSLPSLIHRIGGENAKRIKVMVEDCGCEVKRVRRSRHWQVSGEALNLKALLEQLKAGQCEELRFVMNKLENGLSAHQDKLESLEDKLIRLVGQNPNITLAELMAETNCPIAQARTARFEAEIL